jgi:orotate phosphoribosyltransferase
MQNAECKRANGRSCLGALDSGRLKRIDGRGASRVRPLANAILPLVTRNDLLALFRRSGALLEGHFRLSSGLHSPGYLQCALVLQHAKDAEGLGAALGARLRSLDATVVLSPALGGIVIGQEVGRALGVRAIFAERQDGTLALRRGFTLEPDDRVLVVEDVVTTGGSTRETMEVARAAGATVVGAGAVVDRSGGRPGLDVPFEALLPMDLPTYTPEDCPMCAEGTPVVKPGSRQG